MINFFIACSFFTICYIKINANEEKLNEEKSVVTITEMKNPFLLSTDLTEEFQSIQNSSIKNSVHESSRQEAMSPAMTILHSFTPWFSKGENPSLHIKEFLELFTELINNGYEIIAINRKKRGGNNNIAALRKKQELIMKNIYKKTMYLCDNHLYEPKKLLWKRKVGRFSKVIRRVKTACKAILLSLAEEWERTRKNQ